MATSTESPLRLHGLNLDELNEKFETAHPSDILAWAIANIPSELVQASAFNVDDIAITDLLYRQLKPATPVPVLFLDTLHHFPETLETVAKVKNTYGLNLQIYKIPGVMTRDDFETEYGEALWETDVREFHRLTKIEPLHRGLAELDAQAWITGRRRDQAMTRTRLEIFEFDAQKRLKINPIATWTRKDTWDYVAEHGVIYNPLHDRGYPSIGDEPLTTAVAEGEDERAGRWRGMGKTECGIHMED
ncbi:phosphoadenosine phosphosulfate reductase [Vacuolonema iberomarrocanum]|uniref:phosphoadenosine phosphosulfate reductase n=1 Tax=Vacuolonema iberomarrocanum TaxID=3454632 RepID=UPI0019FA9826|nr:phosphoadenosine phosphosulfate reductase [filamentous cyanobacterium LEGE 07170]